MHAGVDLAREQVERLPGRSAGEVDGGEEQRIVGREGIERRGDRALVSGPGLVLEERGVAREREEGVIGVLRH
jgi:hypothetical protein